MAAGASPDDFDAFLAATVGLGGAAGAVDLLRAIGKDLASAVPPVLRQHEWSEQPSGLQLGMLRTKLREAGIRTGDL